MLLKLSEDVVTSELKEIKFFLEEKIPKYKLHDNTVRPGMSPRWVIGGRGPEARETCSANNKQYPRLFLFVCVRHGIMEPRVNTNLLCSQGRQTSDLPAFPSWVLGLLACATTPRFCGSRTEFSAFCMIGKHCSN